MECLASLLVVSMPQITNILLATIFYSFKEGLLPYKSVFFSQLNHSLSLLLHSPPHSFTHTHTHTHTHTIFTHINNAFKYLRSNEFTNQSIPKEISPGCSLEGSWNSNTLVTLWEELTRLKRPWCWERLRTGGEGDDRGWDGWIASLTQWTWVWVDFRSWWWTGRPDVLWFMGCKESDMTEWLNWMNLQL